MNSTTALLTSFDIWKPKQKSNSSDDLITEIVKVTALPKNLYLLRKLPVNTQLAKEQVITQIDQLQPQFVICCGMAEERYQLHIEAMAREEDEILKTNLDLEQLIVGLLITEISNDAGKFVCNQLYYSILKYLITTNSKTKCVFIHVPILTLDNLKLIVTDFLLLLQKWQIISNINS